MFDVFIVIIDIITPNQSLIIEPDPVKCQWGSFSYDMISVIEKYQNFNQNIIYRRVMQAW